MAQERDDLVYLAKLAEQAERFDEMRGAGAAGSLPTSFIHRAGDELIKAAPRERDAARAASAPNERERRSSTLPRRFCLEGGTLL